MWQQITYSMIQDEQIIMYISSIHFSKCNLSAVINTYHILTVRSPHRAQNSTHTAHPHCKTLNSNIASTREIYKMELIMNVLQYNNSSIESQTMNFKKVAV